MILLHRDNHPCYYDVDTVLGTRSLQALCNPQCQVMGVKSIDTKNEKKYNSDTPLK